MRHRWLLAALSLALVLGCSGKSIDKDGGVILVYQLANQGDTPPATAVTAVRQRMENFFHRGQLQVAELEEGKIQITLIGISDEELETAKKALRATGDLEFRIVALRGKDDKLIAAAESDAPIPDKSKPFARWVRFDPERCMAPEKAVTKDEDGKKSMLVIDDELDVDAQTLKSASPVLAMTGWQIDAQLNAQGGSLMQKLTKRHLPSGSEHRQLAIVFDDEALAAPSITSEISDRFQITGSFTESEVRFIAAILKAGQFPMRLKPEPVLEKRVPPRN